METNKNSHLIAKVLIIGALIAVLSYLFHPEIGQLTVMLNGHPIPEPLARLAAIPTFLVLMGLTIALIVLLFMGMGIFLFFGAIFVALTICIVMAPYIWPILLIIIFVVSAMSFSPSNNR